MFSVVIPLYNKSYGIEKAIESILNQSISVDYEIIIVNDGSTDDSVSKVEKYLCNSNIILINQENSGVSVARNVGIKESKFKYICFLDADDWWNDNYFSTLSKLIKDNPKEVFFLMGYSKVLDHYSKDIRISSKLEIFHHFGNSFSNTRGLVTPSIAITRNVLLSAGLFPEGITLSEDLYLWSKIISKYNVVYSPEIVSNIYYIEDDSRNQRSLKVPYVLQYYSENKKNMNNLNGFLRYIYLAHLYQSYKFNDYDSWKKRWLIGLKIFPFYSFLSLFMGVFFIFKKR